MSESLGQLDVTLKIDFNQLQGQLNKVQSSVDKTSQKIDASLSKAFEKLSSFAKKAAVGIGVSLAGALVYATKEAMAAEDALFGLQAALNNTGDATAYNIKQFKDFAAEIQKVTKYGDDEVISLMALLKNLGVSTPKLEEATKMTIGLAAAKRVSADAMAQNVAMAMQGEYGMLGRLIPALRDTKDETEKLRIVTEFAAKGFQIAKAEAQTTSGAFKQMRNMIGDVAETFGEKLLPIIRDKIQEISKWIEDNQSKIKVWADEFAKGAVKAVASIKTLWDMLGGLEGVVKKVSIALATLALILSAQLAVTITRLAIDIARFVKWLWVKISKLAVSTKSFFSETTAINVNTAALVRNNRVRWSAHRMPNGSLYMKAAIPSTATGAASGGGIAYTLGVAVGKILNFSKALIAATSAVTLFVAAAAVVTGIIGYKAGKYAKAGLDAMNSDASAYVSRSGKSALADLSPLEKQRIEDRKYLQQRRDWKSDEEKQAAWRDYDKKYGLRDYAPKAIEEANKKIQEQIEAQRKLNKEIEKQKQKEEALLKIKELTASISSNQYRVDRAGMLMGALQSSTSKTYSGYASSGAAVSLTGQEVWGNQGGNVSADAKFISETIKKLGEIIKHQTAEKDKYEKIATATGEI